MNAVQSIQEAEDRHFLDVVASTLTPEDVRSYSTFRTRNDLRAQQMISALPDYYQNRFRGRLITPQLMSQLTYVYDRHMQEEVDRRNRDQVNNWHRDPNWAPIRMPETNFIGYATYSMSVDLGWQNEVMGRTPDMQAHDDIDSFFAKLRKKPISVWRARVTRMLSV